MAYINKRTTELLRNLTLSLKVASKSCGKAEHASAKWHTLWDEAAYNHLAIDAILGDKLARKELIEAAVTNSVARATIDRCAYYGVTI